MNNDDEDRYFWRFYRAEPKKVKGGIKAQRRKFGGQWWAQRWLEAIERFGPARRVARGRSYARKGQVLDLRLDPGNISAIVQGSRDEPYQVEISLQRVSPEIETTILRELQSQPIYTATFFIGEVHPDVEKMLGKYGIPLFPTKEEGLGASCSCPDWGNPCKHIAAIYYLISEELERDPMLLLHLRGIPRERLTAQQQPKLFRAGQPGQPLPADPEQFWRAPRLKEVPLGATDVTKPARPAILQRLGPFPFWRGDSDFLQTIELIYDRARQKGLGFLNHKDHEDHKE
ncbi:MAG TPA: SWIM zinc finger family protein [Acidobacteriota bacterium]